MYQIYLVTGTLFIVIGLVTAGYIIYGVGYRKHLLTTINAMATISIGAFYIYCAVLLAQSERNSQTPFAPMSIGEDTILNTTNNRITQDLFEFNNADEPTTTVKTNEEIEEGADFLKNYQELINSLLLKSKIQGRLLRSINFTNNEEDCLRKIFLQHAMMMCAFVQSALFAINNCRECKNKKVNENGDQKTNACYTTGYSFLVLILPTISTLALYYALFAKMEQNSHNSISNATWVNETINHQLDGITSNNSEILDVVEKIYKIINNTASQKPPTVFDVNFVNKPDNFNKNCNYTATPFKLYVFVLVILGYITTIFYMKTVQLLVNSGEISNNLKTVMYLFGSMWLPGIAETFVRVFLTEDMPSMLSDLFATIGSGNILLFNVHDAITARKVSKNMIRPVDT